MPIPKIIHQFWTSENGSPLPADAASNIASLKDTHPDFQTRLWDLESFEAQIEDPTEAGVISAIRACRFPAMQSDIIRLALVYQHGGFWSDLKNRFLSPFIGDLAKLDKPVFVEHPHVEGGTSYRGRFYNAFFGAPPRHPIILDCLTEAVTLVHRRADNGGVYEITGGSLIMRVLRRNEPEAIHPLRADETWGIRMKRTSASYNNDGMHWSVRQKTESLYI